MDLLLSYLASLGMAAALILVHYEILRGIARLAEWMNLLHRLRIITVMFLVFIGHTFEIAFCALTFYVLEDTGLGGFTSEFRARPLDYYRFSAVCYTTVGVGPVEPVGGFGVLAAMEGLIGFLLITWSATFSYSIMQELWEQKDIMPQNDSSPDQKPDS